MRNLVCIRNLIYSMIITIILTYFYFSASNGNLFIIPFLICSISILLKNIFILFKKDNLLYIFNKIYLSGFLLFLILFFTYFYYLIIKESKYLLIIPTVPFIFIIINIIKRIRKDR